MKVKFWGVRGSISSPIRPAKVEEKVKKILSLASPKDIQSPQSIEQFLKTISFSTKCTYGGNTSCIEVTGNSGNTVIIDGGTGSRELGLKLMGTDLGKGKGKVDWLLSHSHWDHIQGLPFFVPLFIPGNEFVFHSSVEDMESRLLHQYVLTHFPVKWEDYRATKKVEFHPEGEVFQITDTMSARSKSVRHPGGSHSFRLEENGKVVIYSSDTEFNLEEMADIENYIDHYKDADVLIFDTQYTFEEQLQKIDWGHSSASMATDIALKAGVKTLVMFHHDPTYDDETIDALYLRALKYKAMMDNGNDLKIIVAYEGLELEV